MHQELEDPKIKRRIAAFLALSVSLWLISLVRGAAYSLYVESGSRMVDEMRIADERVMLASVIGLAIVGGTGFWMRVRDPSTKTRMRLALALGAVTTGVIGAMEASEALGPWAGVRPGWSGIWLVLFPLVLGAGTLETGIAVFGGVVLHLLARLMTLSGTTDFEAELTSFLVLCVVGVIALLPGETAAALARPYQREELGNYVVGDLVGTGGMGQVHRAVHRYLGREVAIKRIASDPTAPERAPLRMQDLRREARLTAALASRHTVELFDFGIGPSGEVYYVMELLRGVDLAELVERFGALPPARTVSLLLQAMDALSEAHALDLIHRDIKPPNLFLCVAGRSLDHLKVLDFGLAGPNERAAGTAGTDGYRAPELLRGEPASVASDMYALGCVARALCTGLGPKEGPEGLPEDLAVSLRIPGPLAALVRRMLAPDPADRPTDQELITGLQALDLEPWTRDRALAWWEQHLPEHLNPLARQVA